MKLSYEGHFAIDARPARMDDFVVAAEPTRFELPVVLIVGSSMSAGKTTTGGNRLPNR